jgi:hypothetical protein
MKKLLPALFLSLVFAVGGPSSVYADAELATVPERFQPAFRPGVTQRTATFSDTPFHVGLCRNRSASVTINSDGTVEWDATVFARKPGPNLHVRLIFIDRNNQRLFQMPFITFNSLPNAPVPWRRTNLAIPEHLFPFITAVVRNDRCDD